MELASVRMTDAAESMTGTGAACAMHGRARAVGDVAEQVRATSSCMPLTPPPTHTHAGTRDDKGGGKMRRGKQPCGRQRRRAKRVGAPAGVGDTANS